jgi:hypothetical protein
VTERGANRRRQRERANVAEAIAGENVRRRGGRTKHERRDTLEILAGRFLKKSKLQDGTHYM